MLFNDERPPIVIGMKASSDAVPKAMTRWSKIRAVGPDAESFLQGQVTQDVSKLTDEPAWSLLLEPTSKITALLSIRRSQSGIEIVVPEDAAEASLTRLKRFLLRVKCELHREDGVVGPWQFDTDRISLRLPGLVDFQRGVTPHTFGRSFVDSTISFTKGCYTGQELVGRLDARGSSVPFRFVSFEAPSIESATMVITSKGPENTCGVSTFNGTADGVKGLAIVHRSLLGDEKHVDVDGVRIDSVD